MCWTEIGRFGKEIANQTALLLPLIVLFVYSIYNTIVVKMFEISRVLTCINIVFMMGKKRKSDRIRHSEINNISISVFLDSRAVLKAHTKFFQPCGWKTGARETAH